MSSPPDVPPLNAVVVGCSAAVRSSYVVVVNLVKGPGGRPSTVILRIKHHHWIVSVALRALRRERVAAPYACLSWLVAENCGKSRRRSVALLGTEYCNLLPYYYCTDRLCVGGAGLHDDRSHKDNNIIF